MCKVLKYAGQNLGQIHDRYYVEIIDFYNTKMLEKNKVIFIVSFIKGVLMKKFAKIAGVIASFMVPLQANVRGQTFSHTFFTARPNFQKGSPERQSFFRNDLMETCCTGWRGAFQIVVYGGKTTKRGSEKLTRYFLPSECNDCCLNFQEYKEAFEDSLTPGSTNYGSSADYNPLKNVEARNFNIVTNNGVSTNLDNGSFASRVCFSAHQSKLGIGLDYKQQLTLKKDGTTGFWFEAAMPVERVRNTIHLRETITNNGGGAYNGELGLNNLPHVNSVRAAFMQQDLLPRRERWGLSDVELFIGYNTYVTEWASTTSYLGIALPAGNHVLGRHLFEAMVGSNRSLGLLFGNETNFNIYRRNCWEIDWILEWNGRYLLESHQVRAFDLIGKPWSRFLETYNGTVEANSAFANANFSSGTFGYNSLRHCIKVDPAFQGILNQAFQFNKTSGCWNFISELGYNLFMRQAEHIHLPECNPVRGVYLKGINGAGTATTARTIKANYKDSVVQFDDPNYTRLQLSACDLDLESASHPAVLSNTIYASVGIRRNKTCPAFFALGTSYEFQTGEINTALERWLVWTKIGITF